MQSMVAPLPPYCQTKIPVRQLDNALFSEGNGALSLLYERAPRHFFCARKSFFLDSVIWRSFGDFNLANILLLLMFFRCVKKLYTFNVGNLLKLRLIIGGKWFSQELCAHHGVNFDLKAAGGRWNPEKQL
ncbi:MAG TPA: hypothetical protein VN642_17200 [Dongiaceae bacterium]|nr:hypothetical protein [Dongiaceae bacterium]